MSKFQLITERRFAWPVTVKVPSTTTPGEHVEQRFTARFRAMPSDEGEALLDSHRSDESGFGAAHFEIDFIKRILVGWEDGVLDEVGNVAPFSEAVLDLAMSFPPFRAGVLAAYRAALNGVASGS